MNIFSEFFNMSSHDIIILSALIAILLTEGLTADEQRTLGDFLLCIGQNIMASSDQKALCENRLNKIADNNGV